jgi:hypothetical protein
MKCYASSQANFLEILLKSSRGSRGVPWLAASGEQR